MNNEEIVQQTLHGDLETAKWAIPRVVKIFVASTRTGKNLLVGINKFLLYYAILILLTLLTMPTTKCVLYYFLSNTAICYSIFNQNFKIAI